MDRRSFVKATSALSALPFVSALPSFGQASARVFTPQPGDWRSFEVTHRVELLRPTAGTKLWIPIPVVEDGYQRNLVTKWTVSSGNAERLVDPHYGAAMLVVNVDDKDAKPVIEMITQLQTQSRAVDLTKRGDARLSDADVKKWTDATAMMPTDGVVLKTARDVT